MNVAGVDVYAGGYTPQLLYSGSSQQRQQQFGAGFTHVFTPTLLMQVGFGLLNSTSGSYPLNWGVNVNKAFGGPNVNVNQFTGGLANVQFNDGGYFTSVAGGTSLNGGIGDYMWLPLQYGDRSYQYNGVVTWSKGTHSIKTGGTLITRKVPYFGSRWPKGNFLFSSLQTNSKAGGSGATGGNSFASLLVGIPYSQSRDLQLYQQEFHTYELGGFIHDDWRINSRITVNAGMRYDIYKPLTEANDRMSTFDPAVPSVLNGGKMIVAGQNGYSRSIVDTEYTHFQPRFGVAWTLGRGTVLRGGFGMSYYPTQMASMSSMKNQPFVNSWIQNTALGQPGVSVPVFGQGVPDPTPSSICLVAACGATASIQIPQAYALDHHDARMLQYNAVLEKELHGNVLSVGYVGSRGYNLNRPVSNGNLPDPPLSATGCGVTTAITLPNPCQPYYKQVPLLTNLQYYNTHDGLIDYDALQVILQRRLSKGLALATNYTWGHSLTNAGSPNGGCTGCGLWLSNWKTYDYGNSEYDIRQRFAFTANYQLPFGKTLQGVRAHLAKAWQVNTIFAYSTGQPMTIMNSGNPQSNIGGAADRPDIRPTSSDFHQSNDQWFDITGFGLQKYGMAGSEGRAQFHGPPQRRLDFSVSKDFEIRESMKLQFRVETFNITNTPSFATPGVQISKWTSSDPATAVPTNAGNFGKITSTSQFYTPRDIQLALKLLF